MYSPIPLFIIMRMTSKISHYHKGFLALLLAPFLWLQMYFHAAQEWLIEILYNELFTFQKKTYSEITHFLSILCFSALSLLAYHKQLDQYISFVLYGLWLINYLSARFRTGLYVDNPAWVKLETREQHWQWSLMIKNQYQDLQQFNYAQIKCVLIAAATYGDDSFRNQVLQIWHVHIQTHDEEQWVVYQSADIQQALLKAVDVAAHLNTCVKIAESFGTSALAEVDLGVQNRPVAAWRRSFISDTVRIYRNFSTLSIFRWLKAVLNELGDFIFIAVMAGCMQRYGLFLVVFFGNDLRLPPPSQEMLEKNSFIVTPFAPEFDWVMLTTFAVTLLVLLHSIYKQSRKHEVVIHRQRIQYRIAGKVQGSIRFNRLPDVLLLTGFDKPSLIIVNEQYQVLEIKDLEEDEYDELYEMLLTA